LKSKIKTRRQRKTKRYGRKLLRARGWVRMGQFVKGMVDVGGGTGGGRSRSSEIRGSMHKKRGWG